MYGLTTDAFKGERISKVEVSEDKEDIVFTLMSGKTLTYYVDGDCCSHSWIEHLTVPSNIEGASVLWAKSHDMPEPSAEDQSHHDLLQAYGIAFTTERGEIIVEFRNSSNGYYGGWMYGPIEAWAKEIK